MEPRVSPSQVGSFQSMGSAEGSSQMMPTGCDRFEESIDGRTARQDQIDQVRIGREVVVAFFGQAIEDIVERVAGLSASPATNA